MSNYNPAGGGLQYRGTRAVAPPNCTFQRTDPTAYDKNGFSLMDLWLNMTTNDVFMLVSLAGTSSSSGSLATWVKLSTGEVGVFSTTGNDLVKVLPDVSGNINIIGADPITVTGDTFNSTETISIATATEIQLGATQLASNTLAIAGSNNTRAVTPASLAAKLGTQTTNGIAYGATTASAIGWTAAGTGGQVLMAHNSGVPQFGSLTSTGNTVTITYDNTLNTINLEADQTSDASVQTTDATPTTLKSIAVAVNTAITVYADVVAAKSDYSAAIGGNIVGTARRAGGALTLVGSPIANINEDSGGSPTFDLVVSGNDFILQVTGEAATTYNWVGLINQVVVAI